MKAIQKSGELAVPQSVVGRVFPVFSLDAKHGVEVQKHTIKAAPDAVLYGIRVGEEGRGRWQSTILVDRPEVDGDRRVVRYASIAETRSGQPKLVAAGRCPLPPDHAVVVLDLGIGFRGGNGFTGDVATRDPQSGDCTFAASPWIPLAIGYIAQGDAGNMGQGTQMVALLPMGVVGRAYRVGRLYGAPASHYYYFDGKALHKRTKDERAACSDVEGDVFPLMAA